MNEGISSREIALKALYEIDVNKGYSNLVLDELFSKIKVKEIDKPLITEMVYGVITRKLTLDYIIEKNSNIKLRKISPWIKNILRLGLYQVLFLTKIPTFAACNESVKLAKKYGHQGSVRFVNAILRKIVKMKEELQDLEKIIDISTLADNYNAYQIRRISVLYSHPEWMVKRWIEEYGLDFTEALCNANNQKPHISIRINTLKTTKKEVMQLLTKQGIEFSESKITDSALILKKGNPINELFNKGMYTIQDEASILVSEILNPEPDEIIADVCAAPGGKTTHIAELMKNRGKIFALDIHPRRLELINQISERLGVQIIETILQDATEVNENLVEKCDRVLVDAPCTGLGVIRKKPDIKWTREEGDLFKLAELQRRILTNSSKYVKPGGRLVYSTCTLNRHENEDVIKEFLKNHNNFEIDPIHVIKQDLDIKKKGYIYLFPHIHRTDGFFIASFRRIS